MVGGRAGRVIRWADCASTSVAYSEVLLGDIYLQVKPVGGEDPTDRIRRSPHS